MMKKYRITATVTVEVVTIVEADSEIEAEKLVDGRDVDICIHGSELANGEASNTDFVLIDGTSDGLTIQEIEEQEYEEDEV